MSPLNNQRPVAFAFVAGIATGMRSMSALAAASNAANRGRLATGNGRGGRLFRSRTTTILLGLAAAGELVGDKLPLAPSRLDLMPFGGRVALGGAVGSIVSRGRGGSPPAGTLAGAAGAFLSTQACGRARAGIVVRTGLPDAVVAIVEDGLALTIAYLAANRGNA